MVRSINFVVLGKQEIASEFRKSILYHLHILDEQYDVPTDLSEYPC